MQKPRSKAFATILRIITKTYKSRKKSSLLLILFSVLQDSIKRQCMLLTTLLLTYLTQCPPQIYSMFGKRSCIHTVKFEIIISAFRKLKGMRPSCHHDQTIMWLSTVTNFDFPQRGRAQNTNLEIPASLIIILGNP